MRGFLPLIFCNLLIFSGNFVKFKFSTLLRPKHPYVLIISILRSFIKICTNKPNHLRRCQAICNVEFTNFS